MSGNEDPFHVAWLKARFAGVANKKEIEAVTEAFKAVHPDQLRLFTDSVETTRQLLQTKAQASGIDDARVFVLALDTKDFLRVFSMLNLAHTSDFYANARLSEDLLRRWKLEDYIEGAKASAESARGLLRYLEDRQGVPEQPAGDGDEDDALPSVMADDANDGPPRSYVCVIASSGTGKTQLAATASLTYETATTIYLNMGKNESTQRFYQPHSSVSKRNFMAELRVFVDNQTEFAVRAGEKNMKVSANEIGLWAQQDNGTSPYVRMLYHLLTGKPFQQEGIKGRVKLSELKQEISGKTFFVFLDEVPPAGEDDFSSVLCLRDTLRYLGIAPILMSTHTGAQDYVGNMSRESLDAWTYIVSALPKYARFDSLQNKPAFLKDTERPLAIEIVKETMNEGLLHSVETLQQKLQRYKEQAWTDAPDLQLVQLFETDVEVNGLWFASAHKLVGHHFGWLFQGGQTGRATYSCSAASRFKDTIEVVPVCAVGEPLLYLALVTWNDKTLQQGASTLFPLVDTRNKPLTVLGAFNQCKNTSFKTLVDSTNQKAPSSDGNLLAVLVHAALTLASMKIDVKDGGDKCLGFMSLKNFMPLVRELMSEGHFEEVPSTPKLFGDLKFDWPTIPALGGSNSRFPTELTGHVHTNVAFGSLERPPNKAMVDGLVLSVGGQAFMSVECKNYHDGVDSGVLKEVFKRITDGIKCSLVFVSSLKGKVFEKTKLANLKRECFKGRKGVSIVVWDKEKDPVYLQVGNDQFKVGRGKVLLLVVIVTVGHIGVDVSRKRKLTYPPCANR